MDLTTISTDEDEEGDGQGMLPHSSRAVGCGLRTLVVGGGAGGGLLGGTSCCSHLGIGPSASSLWAPTSSRHASTSARAQDSPSRRAPSRSSILAHCPARQWVGPSMGGVGLRTQLRWAATSTTSTSTTTTTSPAKGDTESVAPASASAAPTAAASTSNASVARRIWDRILSAASKAAASKSNKDNKNEGGDKTPPPTFPDVRRLFALASPQKKRIMLALGLLVISSAVSLSVPAVIGKVIDFFAGGAATLYGLSFTSVALGLLAVFLIGACAKAGSNILLDLAGIEIIAALRRRSFRNVLRQDVEWADKGAGDVISRLSVDTTIVGESLTDDLGDGLRATITTLGAGGAMLYISTKLTLLMCCVVPPAAIGAVFYSRFIRDLTNKTQDAVGELSKTAEERISPPAFRTVTAFNTQEQEARRFNEKVDEVVKLQTREAVATGFFYSGMGLSGNVAILCLLSYGGHLVSVGEITVGDLTSLLLFTAYLGGGLASVTSFITSLMRAIGAGARVFQLIDREPTIKLSTTGFRPALASTGGTRARPPRIEMERVSFSYPSRPTVPILRDLDLTVEPGESVALVGPSGVGKSSVHALLLRFYDTDAGAVKLDGKDVRDMAPEEIRALCGVVSQTPVLFEASVADNIAYGCEETGAGRPTREAIERAARLANAYDFIMDLPQGFDTVIGPRQLSGGQMQRVAIARALVRQPRILLLDEATSALDSRSEALINQAIESIIAQGQITVWIVAHRLSTIRSAGRVMVLDGGRIVESGSFEELDRPGSRFRKLMAAQLEASGGETVVPSSATASNEEPETEVKTSARSTSA